jgi:predicted Zn-dependent protease
VEHSSLERQQPHQTLCGDLVESGRAIGVDAAHSGFERLDQPQWDVAVAPASKLADPLDAARQRLEQIAKLPIEQQDQAQVRLDRARARYQLGQFEPALADLDFLIENKVSAAVLSQYRAWTLARLGRADEAREELTTYLDQQSDASMQAYVRIVLASTLGDLEEATLSNWTLRQR